MNTRVYLIRHGATSANGEVPYRLQGRGSNRSLDDLGIDQARRTSRVLESIPLVAVYSSPLVRAFETATYVAQAHRLSPIPIEALTEADIGRWEGLTWIEAHALDPELHDQFHANPGTVAYPGGESFADVASRATPALVNLARAHPGSSIAVVAHNVVNRAVLARLLGLPIDQARTLRQANGGINMIEYEGTQSRVVMLNSIFHLQV